MKEVDFTKKDLEERLQKGNEWFDYCFASMNKHLIGTFEHRNWLMKCVNVIKRIFELEDMRNTLQKEN